MALTLHLVTRVPLLPQLRTLDWRDEHCCSRCAMRWRGRDGDGRHLNSTRHGLSLGHGGDGSIVLSLVSVVFVVVLVLVKRGADDDLRIQSPLDPGAIVRAPRAVVEQLAQEVRVCVRVHACETREHAQSGPISGA